MRSEPAPSAPVAIGTTPAATADAAPADDPPEDRSARHGLAVCSRPFHPHAWQAAAGSGLVDVPIGIAPAAASRSTTGVRIVVPAFARNGIPASGPRSGGGSASIRPAAASAAPAQLSDMKCSSGSSASAAASASATSAAADREPARTCAASSAAPAPGLTAATGPDP